MEHRFGKRRDIGITILVRRHGWAGWVVARLADLSISGAFIEGPPGAFPLHSLLQLEAARSDGALLRFVHCRAMVARVSDAGVGLVFDQIRPAGLAPLLGIDGELRTPGAAAAGSWNPQRSPIDASRRPSLG